jgi:ABC-type polysaccharide transport system permease subunit
MQKTQASPKKKTFSYHWRDASMMVGLIVVGAHSDGKLDAPPINTYLIVMAFVPLHHFSTMTSTLPMTSNASTQWRSTLQRYYYVPSFVSSLLSLGCFLVSFFLVSCTSHNNVVTIAKNDVQQFTSKQSHWSKFNAQLLLWSIFCAHILLL